MSCDEEDYFEINLQYGVTSRSAAGAGRKFQGNIFSKKNLFSIQTTGRFQERD